MEFSIFKQGYIAKWQRTSLRVCWICVVAIFGVELALFPLFLKFDRELSDIVIYVIRRIVAPSSINFFAALATTLYSKKEDVPISKKNYLTAFCFLIIAFVLAFFHSFYTIFLLMPTIALFPTIFFYDKKVLRHIFLVSNAMILLSLVIWIKDYAYGNILSIVGVSISILLLHCIIYFFSSNIVRFIDLQDQFLANSYNRQEELIEELHIDPLTRVYNRNAFSQVLNSRIEQSKKQNSSLVLAVVDVDDFHDFNEKYGHAKGDDVLVFVADVIKDALGGNRNIFRYGGDEFCIVFNEQDIKTIEQLAKKICSSVASANLDFLTEELELSISMGISQYKKNMSAEDFFSEADRAMYKAKKIGKNGFVISSES